MPKTHDTTIWERIVEAFMDIGVRGNPTAIAKELQMAQTSVRDWQIGATTPSRRNILEIAAKTKYLAGYLEDGALPKKRPKIDVVQDLQDPMTVEMLGTWKLLNRDNKLRLMERASALLADQFPDADESSELHRR